MNNKKLLLIGMTLVSAGAVIAAQERPVKFTNHVRLGHDDNIYANDTEQDSAFLTEVITLTGELNFSSRQEAVLYWQPEFRYRFDGNPELISYQDLYGELNYWLSERVNLRLNDRFRYQDKEGDVDGTTQLSRENQNYIENSLKGAADYMFDELSKVTVGAGYTFRTWDDEVYGEQLNNDYDQVQLSGSFARELKQDATTGYVGINYSDLSYEGDRGGYKSTALYVGADQTFSPSVSGSASVGVQLTDVDYYGEDNDATAPYLQGAVSYAASEQTSVNGTLGYSVQRGYNSLYSAQNQFSLGLTVDHDLTAKINVASSINYIMSSYDSEFSGDILPDVDSNFITFSVRGAYQINRNNFVECGYKFSDRSGDLEEYDRNQVDVGWRLSL